MKKIVSFFIVFLCACASLYAQTHVRFADPKDWTTAELQKYVGKTVVFDQPVYTCNNYNNKLTASMHRVMSPTNQAIPLSAEYNHLVTIDNSSTFTLNGLSGYHRMGEMIFGLVAKINSTTSITAQSFDSIVGTRQDMERGIPNVDLITEDGVVVPHDLLVCTANLEYYLVENLGTGFGPDNQTQHNKQKTKVLAGLSKINADIYGLVEIEQGQSALAEIASELTRLTGRNFTYINDGGSASGSYTKSGYVYCSDVVVPYGTLFNNNTGVNNRKKMQAFDMVSTGERFIFSLNHFKAKSGTGTGSDANKNDGQGSYNGSRVNEANSVLEYYRTYRTPSKYNDDDILIMGDLNAYAKEDPIRVLTDGGMTDLHRYFHADSSYSYTYHGQAGYLDHALCNNTMLAQVTGMAAYHLNSDESDDFTYDKSNDQTMFRYSDHDPVLVGLKLGATFVTKEEVLSVEDVVVEFPGGKPTIYDAEGGYFTLTSLDGQAIMNGSISGDTYSIDAQLPQGLYILNVYAHGSVARVKYFVH